MNLDSTSFFFLGNYIYQCNPYDSTSLIMRSKYRYSESFHWESMGKMSGKWGLWALAFLGI